MSETTKRKAEIVKEEVKRTGKRLSREQILNIHDIKQEEVYIDEWGGSALVQGLTGGQRDRLAKRSQDENGNIDPAKFRLGMIIEGCIDPKLELEDMDTLNTKNVKALERLASAISKISGFDEDEETEKKS